MTSYRRRSSVRLMTVLTVGVDGSECAAAALHWAAAEARLRGARLRAVHAWNIPTMAYGYVPPVSLDDDLGRAAADGLDRWLEAAASDLEGIEVERLTVEGSASTVLTEAAGDAELLVVGSRGLGGFRELLLGSVSHQCAQRAPCPVVIVR
jgi:nucleotide-binding universal stress UspA family protein